MNYPNRLPIKCGFCQQDATYCPLEEMERHSVHVFFCYPCKAEYLLFNDGRKASHSLYTEINGHTYRWTHSSANTAQLWLVEEPGIPGQRKNGKLKIILALNEYKGHTIPLVTPDNIMEKVKTWLLFL
jgi:hypothetical protein